MSEESIITEQDEDGEWVPVDAADDDAAMDEFIARINQESGESKGATNGTD